MALVRLCRTYWAVPEKGKAMDAIVKLCNVSAAKLAQLEDFIGSDKAMSRECFHQRSERSDGFPGDWIEQHVPHIKILEVRRKGPDNYLVVVKLPMEQLVFCQYDSDKKLGHGRVRLCTSGALIAELFRSLDVPDEELVIPDPLGPKDELYIRPRHDAAP